MVYVDSEGELVGLLKGAHVSPCKVDWLEHVQRAESSIRGSKKHWLGPHETMDPIKQFVLGIREESHEIMALSMEGTSTKV